MTAQRPVLIAEDDEQLRALLAELLLRSGHDVREAGDGEAAVAAALLERPSVVVLDVGLPLLSGYDVCGRLREAYGETVGVIFISGEQTESYDRVAAFLLGADDFLVKPFAEDELLVRVRSLMRRAAPEERDALSAVA
jgi:DNA-binding response OmpR family regulator